MSGQNPILFSGVRNTTATHPASDCATEGALAADPELAGRRRHAGRIDPAAPARRVRAHRPRFSGCRRSA